MSNRKFLVMFFACLALSLSMSGCSSLVKVKLFTSLTDPLKERVLSGAGEEKIALIPIEGIISDQPGFSLFRSKPSVVQQVVSQLSIAGKDPLVKGVVLKVNSPGGGVTASDMLYHEIVSFKKQTGKPVVACMMDIATSGGYYVSLPADHVQAHPTTVTGSVGVIFLRPKLVELMDKIGVGVEVSKSGENKDMGSPFRPGTAEESEIFQEVIDGLADRFLKLVKKHREIDAKGMAEIESARIYLPKRAKALRLIDSIGYIDDAVDQAKRLAGAPKNARLVVYRRGAYPNDNVYNPHMSHESQGEVSLVKTPWDSIVETRAGFHYLWLPRL